MSEYTPEQLRDWAKVEEEMGEQEGPVRAKLRQHVADQLRAHAAALESLQSADEDRLRMRAQTARLDAALIEKDISIAARDAELALAKAEAFSMRNAAVAATERAEAAERELAALKAENSKLRSALEIVHFKREPWQ